MNEETETRGVLSPRSMVQPGSIISDGPTFYEVQGVHLGGVKEVDYLTLRPILGEAMPTQVNVGRNRHMMHDEAYFTVPYRMLEGKRWWQSAAIMACEAHATAEEGARLITGAIVGQEKSQAAAMGQAASHSDMAVGVAWDATAREQVMQKKLERQRDPDASRGVPFVSSPRQD